MSWVQTDFNDFAKDYQARQRQEIANSTEPRLADIGAEYLRGWEAGYAQATQDVYGKLNQALPKKK